MNNVILSKEKFFNILKQTELFKNVDNKVLYRLIETYPIQKWSKNDSIDYAIGLKYCYILISGHIKLTKIDPKTGRSITPFILQKGDLYDFFTLLDGKEHISFPIVLDEVSALKVPIDDMRMLIKSNYELNISFLPYLGEKMRNLEEFGESLVFDDTATRLSKLILKHTVPSEDENFHPVKLINKLSHETLAEMIGSVRSVITTQMNKLKKENIIVSNRGYLVVKEFEKLIEKCDNFLENRVIN